MMQTTKMLSQEFIENAINNPLQDQKCCDLHLKSCNVKAAAQFLSGCQSIYKMYFMVHLVPLVLRRKKLMKKPKEQLKKFVIGFIRSMLFAGGYSMLIRKVVCLVTKYIGFKGQHCSAISGYAPGFMLLFEPISRQSQIALFCLKNSMEVVYLMAKRRSYPVGVPMGQCLLNAIATSILAYVYFSDRYVYRENYRSFLDKLLKDI